MTASYMISDVFDGLAKLEDGSVDLVVTSPPFLALRSYLPADHPDKGREIGSEATPAAFLDVMLAFTAELRRVVAPHGSIAIELGDTYAGGGGENNLYTSGYSGGVHGMNTKKPEGQGVQRFALGLAARQVENPHPRVVPDRLAYGINPLTGQPSPAGQWRVRNVVTWARPNPPVGALGDKWRPATSDVVVACTSSKRYWDDLATRKPHQNGRDEKLVQVTTNHGGNKESRQDYGEEFYNAGNPAGAPLLDYWVIPPGGYEGSHYAVFPPELVVPLVKAMTPERVCRECGEPSRRIVQKSERYQNLRDAIGDFNQREKGQGSSGSRSVASDAGGYDLIAAEYETTGWTDCGHDNYRPGLVLDPFAGSGTTLLVATGHGHDAIGIDLDSRNAELALQRVGPFLLEVVNV